jgi:GDPmannose 4,6-dehydratase
MWLMMQQEVPEDYVIATGVTTSVRDFLRLSFQEVGIELEFKGEGVDEVARVASCRDPRFQLPTGKVVATVDPIYFRPTEVDLLVGDATKAREQLGWQPEYTLQEMVSEMVRSDLAIFSQ